MPKQLYYLTDRDVQALKHLRRQVNGRRKQLTPQRRRRTPPAGSGRSSSQVNLSQFALIIEGCDASIYNIGDYVYDDSGPYAGGDSGFNIQPPDAAAKAILLSYRATTLGNGNPAWGLACGEPEYSYGYSDAQLIWVYCLSDHARLEADDVVMVFSPGAATSTGGFGGSGGVMYTGISPGLYDDNDNPNIAYLCKHVNVEEYLGAMPMYAPNKALFTFDGISKKEIDWAGRPCSGTGSESA